VLRRVSISARYLTGIKPVVKDWGSHGKIGSKGVKGHMSEKLTWKMTIPLTRCERLLHVITGEECLSLGSTNLIRVKPASANGIPVGEHDSGP
jgi:hypothetical protein